MSFEQRPQKNKVETKPKPVMAGEWVNGKFVERSFSEINKEVPPESPKESSTEINAGFQAEITAREQLAYAKKHLTDVESKGAGNATVFGVPGEEFLAGPKAKLERARQQVANAESVLLNLRAKSLADSALEDGVTEGGALDLLSKMEEDAAAKLQKKFHEISEAQKSKVDTKTLEEEREYFSNELRAIVEAKKRFAPSEKQ